MNTYLRRTIGLADKNLLQEDACHLECRFDRLVAEGAFITGSLFIDCRFEEADLYWCQAFRSHFVDCVFKACDLRGNFDEAIFGRCRFSNCKYGLDNVGGETRWEGANAIECSVAGPPLPLCEKRD